MTATDPRTPVQPAAPPRKRRLIRNTLIALAAAACLAAAVTASWLALASGHHPAPAPRPADTLFSPSASVVTPMAVWCAGRGDAALQHVRADLNQVGADARGGNLAATEADGIRLTADAEAAEALPPPVTQAQQLSYVEAMGALSFAGIDMSAGNLTAANRAISAASGYLSQDKGIITCP